MLCKVILYRKSHPGICSPLMQEYCKNTKECWHNVLMSVFLDKHSGVTKPTPIHACCDICSVSCKCVSCVNVLPEVLQPDKLDDIPSEPATVVPLSAKVMVHNEPDQI